MRTSALTGGGCVFQESIVNRVGSTGDPRFHNPLICDLSIVQTPKRRDLLIRYEDPDEAAASASAASDPSSAARPDAMATADPDPSAIYYLGGFKNIIKKDVLRISDSGLVRMKGKF